MYVTFVFSLGILRITREDYPICYKGMGNSYSSPHQFILGYSYYPELLLYVSSGAKRSNKCRSIECRLLPDPRNPVREWVYWPIMATRPMISIIQIQPMTNGAQCGAVCDKFNDFLFGSKFTVRIDNNPLAYVLSTA